MKILTERRAGHKIEIKSNNIVMKKISPSDPAGQKICIKSCKIVMKTLSERPCGAKQS